MSSSQRADKDARNAEEYDSTRRSVNVYLFTRPVDDKLPDKIEYHHWALVFVFKGDDVRTVEGFADSKGKLFPKYTKLYPEERGTYYTLCTMTLSPSEVLQAAINNRYNDEKYSSTWQNCQVWVKALAKSLGGDIARKIDNYHTLKEANPVVAIAGKKKSASGFGSFSSSS